MDKLKLINGMVFAMDGNIKIRRVDSEELLFRILNLLEKKELKKWLD